MQYLSHAQIQCYGKFFINLRPAYCTLHLIQPALGTCASFSIDQTCFWFLPLSELEAWPCFKSTSRRRRSCVILDTVSFNYCKTVFLSFLQETVQFLFQKKHKEAGKAYIHVDKAYIHVDKVKMVRPKLKL